MYRQTFLKHHVLWYFIGRAGAGIISFLSVSLFARLLLPEGYGLYTIIMSSVIIFNSLLFQWIRIALIRYLPGSEQKRVEIVSNLFKIYILENISLYFTSFLLFLFDFGIEIILFAVILTAQSWFDTALELFRVDLKPIVYSLMLLGRSILSFGTGLLLIGYGLGAIGALLAQLIGLSAMGIVAYYYQRHTIRLSLYIERRLAIQFVAYGFPISLALLMGSVVAYIDRFLIAVLEGRGSAGAYAAVYDIVSSIMLLTMQLPVLSGFPIAVEAYQKGDHEFCRQIVLETYLAAFRLCAPVAVGMVALSEPITNLLLGSDYGHVHSLLWCLCPALIIYGLMEYYYNRSLWLSGRPWYLLGVMGFACIANAILNLILIPHYSVMGAAVATLAAYFCAAVISRVLAQRTFSLLPLVPRVYSPFFSALVMGFVVIITSFWDGLVAIIFRLALGFGVYYGGLHLFGKWFEGSKPIGMR
jgi:O-antigen/teichoic acid export membrane protein